jgi:hypothetical protein
MILFSILIVALLFVDEMRNFFYENDQGKML